MGVGTLEPVLQVYPALAHWATVFRASGAALRLTSRKLQTTNGELQITSYELRIANHQSRAAAGRFQIDRA
jgi:hypothetical protein